MKINTAALALLAATATAAPLSAINATLSAVNATGTPFTNATATATGPGDSFEPCVMPDGCRWTDKRPGPFDPPRTTVPHVSSITTEPASITRPNFGEWISSIIGGWDTSSPVPTETSTTDTRDWPTMPIITVPTPSTFKPAFGTPPPRLPEITLPTLIRPTLPTIELPTPSTFTRIRPVFPTAQPMA